jgi:hypothetical protein
MWTSATLNYGGGQNLGIVADGTSLRFYNDGATIYSATIANFVETNKWLYAVATYDGTTTTIYGIKDGILSKNTTIEKSGNSNIFDSDFRIIGNQYALYFTAGKCSTAFVYDRTLTEIEIINIYNKIRKRFGV